MAICPQSSSAAADERPPKISVLVPTYNYARYLPQAIESILVQKYDDLEILISDDASTDDSARIIAHYAARDPRIRVALHSSNLGMVANWNWCLREARGDYVKFVFGDDLLTSTDALTRMAAVLDQNPDAAIVASARLLVDQDSKITGVWDHLSPSLIDGPGLIARCLRTRRNLVGEPSSVMFRRSLASRGFDPAYRQIVDLEMWFHLMMQGSLCYLSEPLCGFRQHATQQTVVNGRLRVTDLELVNLLERYQQFPSLHVHLQPHGWAYRWILFRQLHYARKAVNLPGSAAAVVRLKNQIPPHWQIVYWIWHRLTRPLENLARKAKQWSQSVVAVISLESAIRRKRQEAFLRALPPLVTAPSFQTHAAAIDRKESDGENLATVHPSNHSNDLSEFAALFFQHRFPRRIAITLILLGAFSAIGILSEEHSGQRAFDTHGPLSSQRPPRFGRHHPLGMQPDWTPRGPADVENLPFTTRPPMPSSPIPAPPQKVESR